MPENRTQNCLNSCLDFISNEMSPLYSPAMNPLVTVSGEM